MSDHVGPPRERGMFVKEAYLPARRRPGPRRGGGRTQPSHRHAIRRGALGRARRRLPTGRLPAGRRGRGPGRRPGGLGSGLARLVQSARTGQVPRLVQPDPRQRLSHQASQAGRQRTLDVDEVDLEGGDPFRAALARDAVGRALSGLSTELRMVVVLRYWGELSLAEIADRLGHSDRHGQVTTPRRPADAAPPDRAGGRGHQMSDSTGPRRWTSGCGRFAASTRTPPLPDRDGGSAVDGPVRERRSAACCAGFRRSTRLLGARRSGRSTAAVRIAATLAVAFGLLLVVNNTRTAAPPPGHRPAGDQHAEPVAGRRRRRRAGGRRPADQRRRRRRHGGATSPAASARPSRTAPRPW